MLSSRSRQGFTLIELMLSLVLVLAVSGALLRLVLSSERLSRDQAARIAVQSSMRGAVLVVSNELRELSTASGGAGPDNDILGLGATALSYRAMRGFGLTCQPLSAGLLRLSRSSFTGFRDPQPGRDSAWVYAPGLRSPADSGWIPSAITSVSTSVPCPGTTGPALTLSVVASPPLVPLPVGTPVRVYELMQVASYRSEGQFWLGLRALSTGEAIQPLFGPLTADGFRLAFADAAGLATALPGAVRSIQVTLTGMSGALDPVSRAPLIEQVSTRIQLRNARP